jgi:peptide/nickel transport system permease protein
VIGYVLKRIIQAVIVILLVTVAVFGLLHALPGGPARGILGIKATQLQIAEFNRSHGFDRALPVQYWMYLDRVLHGNLGESYVLDQSVSSLLIERVPKTLVLTGLSTLIALVLAVPLGVFQARHRGGLRDSASTSVALIGYAMPSFFLALILVIVFAETFHVFPPEAPQTSSTLYLLEHLRALILPIATGAITTLAAFSRYCRSSVLDSLSQDYVRTAYAKGASERRVVWVHVLRNSVTSLVALLGYYLPVLFAGAVVVESIYNYPGVGLLFWNAAQESDYPVLLGVVLVISVATVVGSLGADLLQALVDPRVRGSMR